ncbi:MAG: PIN domain-containing protein [Deltaproteobacteria bacterium]|jgi:predicted nucleic acid-binding protein|nr:PIN domain-containing protein [Deltaproteobacteria bacterium]
MSVDKAFVDTNLFVYLYSDKDIFKKELVRKEINNFKRFISTQVLNEFCNVCTKKLKLPLITIYKAIIEIRSFCEILIIDHLTVMAALRFHEKYKYSYYDCLMIASALETDCKYLLSEDLADGQEIEGRLTIKNIFKK